MLSKLYFRIGMDCKVCQVSEAVKGTSVCCSCKAFYYKYWKNKEALQDKCQNYNQCRFLGYTVKFNKFRKTRKFCLKCRFNRCQLAIHPEMYFRDSVSDENGVLLEQQMVTLVSALEEMMNYFQTSSLQRSNAEIQVFGLEHLAKLTSNHVDIFYQAPLCLFKSLPGFRHLSLKDRICIYSSNVFSLTLLEQYHQLQPSLVGLRHTTITMALNHFVPSVLVSVKSLLFQVNLW